MNQNIRTYLICISIIIASIILGVSIYNGFDILGQYINDGLRIISQSQ